jgi:hypothetical protein
MAGPNRIYINLLPINGLVEIWRNLTTAEINGITQSILSVCVDALVFIANGQPIPKMREIPYFSAFSIGEQVRTCRNPTA